jgi:hypothetical protein
LKTNGPEPIGSAICLPGSVSAMRLGIMKGTMPADLPSAASTRPVGCFTFSTKLLASTTRKKSMKSVNTVTSRALQRLSDATQSSAVTGCPSCQMSPSRSVKV